VASMRQLAKYKLKNLYYQIDYSQDNVQNLHMLDLKLGNTCNLSCRICNGYSSIKVAEQQLSHQRITHQQFVKLKESVSWADSEQFEEQLLSISKNLTHLDLYGGEPLMSKMHFNFLQAVINLGVAGNISLDYNTNGTVYSNKFFDYWKHFKEVKLSFSIDNIGKRFELERNGASWDTVCENIARFNAKTSAKFKTDVYPTVSLLNVYYLPEFLSWADVQNFSQPPSFNMLSDPDYFAINNLSVNVKKIVTKKLLGHSRLLSIVDYMNQNGKDLTDVAKTYIRRADQEQAQNFAETHSEFANIIDY